MPERRVVNTLLGAQGVDVAALEALFASVHLATRDFHSTGALLGALDEATRGCIVAQTVALEGGIAGFQCRLRDAGIHLPVIYLATDATVAMAVEAFKSGAVDFLEVPFNEQALLDAVNSAIEADRQASRRRGSRQRTALRFRALTPRERELVEPMVKCWPNRRIARRLGVSEKTVEAYRSRVMRKTGAANLPDLMRMAMRAGFVDDAGRQRDHDQ